jgi:hypothetical protein
MPDLPPPPDPYRFRDPRQERIYRRLLRVGENAAAFYRDVCRLLDGAVRLETAAHAIAFSLREIESAMRAVLLPLVEPARLEEARRRARRKDKTWHREQVEAILETLGLANVPAPAETWRRLADPDGDSGLHRLAHRDALAGPRVLSEPLLRLVGDINELLDVVLARFEARYVSYVRRLDAILAKPTPTDGDVNELKNEIPNSPAILRYFFDGLIHFGWLAPLREAGFFLRPQEPSKHDDGSVIFPLWPASRYLARLAAAPEAQAMVLEIALAIPPTDNVRVHEDLADIALALPAGLAEYLVPRAKAWIASPYKVLLPEKLGGLVSHLARGRRPQAALDLASALLEVRPDPREPVLDPDGTVRLQAEAVGHFDVWHYEQILKRNIPDLVDTACLDAFKLLCDLLEAAVRMSRAREDDAGPEDYSYIWRPSIEDHAQNVGHSLRGALVSAVRRATCELGRHDPSLVPTMVRPLEERPLRVFHRLALHLLRTFRGGTAALAAKRLTDRRLFETIGLQHEYRLLLRDRFPELSPGDQALILGWIETGPDPDKVRVGLERLHGAPPTEAKVEGYTNAWRVDHLAILVPHLPTEWRQRYVAWRGGAPEPEDPEFPVHVSGWHGSSSPKSVEELRVLSVEEVVDFLLRWQPPDDRWTEPSRDGLESAITAAVTAEPVRFADEAHRFKNVEPGYVMALFWGLRAALKERPRWDWHPVLEICEWVARQTDDPARDPGREEGGRHPLRSAKKAAVSFLHEALRGRADDLPFDLRREVWSALAPFAEDPDPTPEDEARHGGARPDPATFSINTVRGEALHGVVQYALWVRRHLEREPGAVERLARGFDEMAEVRTLLGAHLELSHDPSLAIRAVYGQWLPWLVLLDRGWVAAHLTAIFSDDPTLAAHRDAAWVTYITLCKPYDNVLDLIKGEYRRAADHLGAQRAAAPMIGDPEEGLADHLTTFFARGRLSLDVNDPISAFYRHASVGLRRYALVAIGQRLAHEPKPVPLAVLERLTRLWSTRLGAVRAASGARPEATELETFGWWFTSGAFEDAWAVDQLAQALEITAGRTDPHHDVMESLARLPSTVPRAALACMRHMVEGDVEGWVVLGSSGEIRAAVGNALRSSDAETRGAAAELVSVLIARGYPEFKDLLES